MINVFLDTSALFKLYHKEVYSEELSSFLSSPDIAAMVISELAVVEYASIVWRLVSERLIDEIKASLLLQAFENDRDKYFVIDFEAGDMEKTKRLLNSANLNKQRLRTLDGLQMNALVKMGDSIDIVVVFDKQLKKLVKEYLNMHVFETRASGLAS